MNVLRMVFPRANRYRIAEKELKIQRKSLVTLAITHQLDFKVIRAFFSAFDVSIRWNLNNPIWFAFLSLIAGSRRAVEVVRLLLFFLASNLVCLSGIYFTTLYMSFCFLFFFPICRLTTCLQHLYFSQYQYMHRTIYVHAQRTRTFVRKMCMI